MHPHRVTPSELAVNRREWLRSATYGLGSIALASMLQEKPSILAHAENDRQYLGGLPGLPHHPPRARHVIFLAQSGGPYLFGQLTMADAMYAPVCTRFQTYGVALDPASQGYCRAILEWPAMVEWMEAARAEPDELEELDAEF